MRLVLLQSLLPLAVSVGAISIVEPKKGAEISASDSFTVKWTSVSTDPSSFDLYIVNNAVYPPVEEKIASSVETSEGSYTVDGVSVPDGHGFQINFLSDNTQNTGILAQSEQFNVTDSASSSSTTTSSSTSTSTSSTSASSTSASSSTTTSSDTTTTTTSGSTTTTTGTSTSSTGSSSAAGSSTGALANSTAPEATYTPSPGAGVALTAPLTAVTGLLLGALLFSL